ERCVRHRSRKKGSHRGRLWQSEGQRRNAATRAGFGGCFHSDGKGQTPCARPHSIQSRSVSKNWRTNLSSLSQTQVRKKMEQVEAPVTDGFVVICEKCGLKLSSADDNLSRQIQKNLKGMFRDAFGKKVMRPIVSSWLDLCPKDKIAVGFLWNSTEKDNSFFTFTPPNPDKDAKMIFEKT